MEKNIHKQCWNCSTNLENIKLCIKCEHHIILVMRGLPGSGKTHLANELIAGTSGKIFSTDSFFSKNNIYKFCPSKLSQYHRKNIANVKNAIFDGVKLIIVDNTNIHLSDVRCYVLAAVRAAYEVYFVEPETSWRNRASECARRCIHDVTKEKIQKLLDEYEKFTLQEIIRPIKVCDEPIHHLDDPFVQFYEDNPPTNVQSDSNIQEQRTSLSNYFKTLCLTEDKMVDIGTQTSDIIQFLYVTNNMPDEDLDQLITRGECREKIRTTCPDFDKYLRYKNRSTQTTSLSSRPSDFSLLYSIFPSEDPANLKHLLDMIGLELSVSIFREMHCKIATFGSVEEFDFPIEVLALSGTYPCKSDENLPSQKDDELLNSTARDSPNSLGSQGRAYNVNLTEMFDGYADDYAEYDISLAVRKQSNESCSADIRKVASDYDSLVEEFPSLNLNDVNCEINENGGTYQGWTNQGTIITAAQKLNLRKLIDEFSSIPPQCIRECFFDTNCSMEATRNTLNFSINPGIEDLPSSSNTNHYISNDVTCYASCSTQEPEPDASKDLHSLCDEVNKNRLKHDEFVSKANRTSDSRIKQYYLNEASFHARKARMKAKELNQKAVQSNTLNTSIDLHFMDVPTALNFLKSRLSSLNRPIHLRNSRSTRKLKVITGYGKFTNGCGRIKQAVKNWLKQNKYEYHFSNNPGEIYVLTK